MDSCEHLRTASDLAPERYECEDCVKTGDTWVHLRICLSCGHVGCCDSSRNKHATAHFRATRHAMVRSIEPGEDWGWCYADNLFYDLSEGVARARVVE